MTDGQSEACRDQIQTSGSVCKLCDGNGWYFDEAGQKFMCQCRLTAFPPQMPERAQPVPAYITAAEARQIAREVVTEACVFTIKDVRDASRKEVARLMKEKFS